MTARILGVSAVLVAVGAAGLGGYLAGRPASDATVVQAPSQIPSGQTPSSMSTPEATSAVKSQPVTESEGVVSPAAPASATAAASTTPVERPSPAATTRTTASAASAAKSRPATPSTPKPVARTPISPRPTVASDSRAASQPAPAVVARDEAPRPSIPEPAPQESSAIEPSREPADDRPTAVVDPPPATPRLEEYVIPTDSVIGLQLDETVSTETARVEQRVEAHVSRDVRINGAIVIPAGSRAHGQVTLVENGGKFRERARLGVRFHTLVLGDGESVPIQTDTIYREGEAVGQRSAARIGGSAVGGAIIGAIFGGGRGAAIGAAAGAGAGTAATMATPKSQVTLHTGSTVTVRLTSPTTITLEREN